MNSEQRDMQRAAQQDVQRDVYPKGSSGGAAAEPTAPYIT